MLEVVCGNRSDFMGNLQAHQKQPLADLYEHIPSYQRMTDQEEKSYRLLAGEIMRYLIDSIDAGEIAYLSLHLATCTFLHGTPSAETGQEVWSRYHNRREDSDLRFFAVLSKRRKRATHVPDPHIHLFVVHDVWILGPHGNPCLWI